MRHHDHLDDGEGFDVKRNKPLNTATPRTVYDPELSEEARELIRKEAAYPGSYTQPVSPWSAAAPTLLRGGFLTGVAGLIWWWSVNYEAPTPDPLLRASALGAFKQMVADNLGPLLSGWPIAAVIVVVLAWGRASFATSRNHKVRTLAEAKNRCVRAEQLTEEAQALLVRAQRAGKAVLESAVHRRDLIDKQRNELMLPAQEWEIAEALRDYSLLVRQEPAEPQGKKVAELLGTRRRALKASLEGIERRVTALEAYAAQVATADARYEEFRQIEQLAEGSSDVLDLLARTARDDLAVAEINGLAGEAAVVADTFTKALESAKQAAVEALPLRKAA
ncbi:hypothetical protein P8605_02665 [Streptomyces sp. T-3]|nr:hypothetical protein [Streptomyces sp. T-3]